ncbi:hypothetical protein IQ257_20895 [Coleofasciculus sp. LEGE 07092]|nr:hypothetical protein [Coleofasciculus sp. LEGE 07081]MBE9127337.1 hypothetical protein [Coleofasciculus sp. LEGE 07081]MBE9150903.1 hypothetical protein [Coleofasciculus sp. LEGE 07092]
MEQQIKEAISLRHGFAYCFSFGWFARIGFTHSGNQLLCVNMLKLAESAIALRVHVAITFINAWEIILEALVANEEFNLIYLAQPIRGKRAL